MDASYIRQFENFNIIKRLSSPENTLIIEELLYKEYERLKRLKELKKDGKLNFGPQVPPEELMDLVLDVCAEVDRFLGIQERRLPHFGYYRLTEWGSTTTPILIYYVLSAALFASGSALFVAVNLPLYLLRPTDPYSSLLLKLAAPSLVLAGAVVFIRTAMAHYILKKMSMYDPHSRRVILERYPRAILIPVVGHEYTHSLQDDIIFGGYNYSDNYSILTEGHAIGVERHVARCYSEREGNEAFLYHISKKTVRDLKRVYEWMRGDLGRKARETRDAKDLRRLTEGLTPHSIGNTFFSICEAQRGEEIYKQIIHGTFQFT